MHGGKRKWTSHKKCAICNKPLLIEEIERKPYIYRQRCLKCKTLKRYGIHKTR